MQVRDKIRAAAAAVSTAALVGAGSVYAAVPTAVTTAFDDLETDLSGMITTTVLPIVIAVSLSWLFVKYAKRGLGSL